MAWRLAQVDAPEGEEECYAADSLGWLQEYVRPLSHTYFVVRPTGEDHDAEGRLLVEMVVADDARMVGDRGSVNVAAVRAGMARWTGVPGADSGSAGQASDFAGDLADRMSAAEADARANFRGLWGACQDA